MLRKSFATAFAAAAMILSLGGVAHAGHTDDHDPKGRAVCEGPPGDRVSGTARNDDGRGISDSDAPQRRVLTRCLQSPGESENSYT